MKVPAWSIPASIVLATLAGLAAARMMAIPSLTLDFSAQHHGSTQTVAFLVDGVRCVDTARRAASTLEEMPGVLRFVAYAARNRVEVTFDPEKVSIAALHEAIEGPIWVEETGEFLFNVFRVVETDGEPSSG